jgi:hypothetical protein
MCLLGALLLEVCVRAPPAAKAELARREEDVTMHVLLDTQRLPELSFWHSANWRGTKK